MSVGAVLTEITLTTGWIGSWLFPQIDAAMHHGGAGTTGASLRGKSFPFYLRRPVLMCSGFTAGVPTLIKPWFGDQFFWASRVQKLGVEKLSAVSYLI